MHFALLVTIVDARLQIFRRWVLIEKLVYLPNYRMPTGLKANDSCQINKIEGWESIEIFTKRTTLEFSSELCR
jgi:hypothetical protein